MQDIMIDHAKKWPAIRERIDRHRSWIEQQLSMTIEQAIVVEVDTSLPHLALNTFFAFANRAHAKAERFSRLAEVFYPVAVPEYLAPGLAALHSKHRRFSLEKLRSEDAYTLSWIDSPTSFRMRDRGETFVALNVDYRLNAYDQDELAHVVVLPPQLLQPVLQALDQSRGSVVQPRLHAPRSYPRLIEPCRWDDLLLDDQVISLLKNDFESFFERYEWFRKMHLPFRRGYLLFGSPGNGKTSAIRAMLTSRRLSAHTIRLFDSKTEDSDLDNLFSSALEDGPAVVLLEDLDRAFGKGGEKQTKVSLQQLLNCLDGVSTADGLIVVATANEPSLLDPAILRRPGRFDRSVHFRSPDPSLRRKYFSRLYPEFAKLDDVVANTAGFSFAFLKETHVLAGQAAFEENRDINCADLEKAACILRETMRQSTQHSTASGFRSH